MRAAEQGAGSKGERGRISHGLLAGFAAYLAGTPFVVVNMDEGDLDLTSYWLLLRLALVQVVASHLALLVSPPPEARRFWVRESATYAFLFVALLALFWGLINLGEVTERFRGLLPAFVAGVAVIWGVRRWSGVRRTLAAYLAAGLAVVAFLSTSSARGEQADWGEARGAPPDLVGFPPSRTDVTDGSLYLNKDGYPLMTFRYNRLGFRDEEPVAELKEGQRRVLIVGDSFVWGDGIATNEETIGYQLRQALEARAPGAYVVMSLAFPGNGFHGYERAIQAAGRHFPPDLIIVGSLGRSDADPLDAQRLQESLPSSTLFRNLIWNLKILQRVHVVAVVHREHFWESEANMERNLGILERIARDAAAAGRKVILLHYLERYPLSGMPGMVEFELPEELRYPNHRNEYWYEKDFHPKATLNAKLGVLLAERVLEQVPPAR
ncbi:MAG: SGNH/GDSL hydrolase family protein [Deltaproteobacteria bacterium]|nr:SGNH/GDSL hydrolase family protein [Deltaproteobacteria bacterium]